MQRPVASPPEPRANPNFRPTLKVSQTLSQGSATGCIENRHGFQIPSSRLRPSVIPAVARGLVVRSTSAPRIDLLMKDSSG